MDEDDVRPMSLDEAKATLQLPPTEVTKKRWLRAYEIVQEHHSRNLPPYLGGGGGVRDFYGKTQPVGGSANPTG